MNKFRKYCPNVWVAECDEKYEKGEVIQLVTKHGKEVDCEIYNFLCKKDDKYYYSIVRIEEKTYAERKADKYRKSAVNAARKSDEYCERSQEARAFLSLGEPIKVGHHSEKRHRSLIERNWNRMGKSVAFAEKAKDAEQRAAYWDSKSKEITLAMPESLEYFKYELERAVEYHSKLKSGEIEQEHAYSMAYASKAVRELKKKVEIAQKLWGEGMEQEDEV